MIYSSDFNYLKRYNENVLHMRTTAGKLKERKSIWRIYCERSTIAETFNIVNPESYRIERLCWIIIFILSVSYTLSVCVSFFRIFSRNMFETVLDDIQYPVYKINFPAVTICNTNSLNWDRIEEAKSKFLPANRTKNLENLFEDFIGTFENYRLGLFREFAIKFDNRSLTELDDIVIDDVLQFMTFKCDELFSTNECEWRSKKVNCCEEFVSLKSIFGHCYTFNSEITPSGIERSKQIPKNYPKRSPGEGEGSGIRFRVNLHLNKKRPGNGHSQGLRIIVHQTNYWPSGHGITFSNTALPQTQTSVALQPEIYKADPRMKRIYFKLRECLFNEESYPNLYEYLPGQPYGFGNCLLQCKFRYAQMLCGCMPDMSFPASNLTKRPCRASDFKCLGAYDRVFKQFTLNNFGSDMANIEVNMECHCIFTCAKADFHGTRRYYYDTELDPNFVNVEIFFGSKVMIMFQMTTTFEWTDLLVSFGGIAGLFLGCSVISLVEVLYHIYIGLRGNKIQRKISGKN